MDIICTSYKTKGIMTPNSIPLQSYELTKTIPALSKSDFMSTAKTKWRECSPFLIVFPEFVKKKRKEETFLHHFTWAITVLALIPQSAAAVTDLRSVQDQVAASTYAPTSAPSKIWQADLNLVGEATKIFEEKTNEPPEMVSEDPYSLNSTSLKHLYLNETDYVWDLGYFSNATAGNSTNDDNTLYDVPLYLVILLSIVYGCISVIAVIGNFLILWIIVVSQRLRTKTNMFIANLALADIIIALFAIPFQFQAALLQRWNLPEFMCGFCPFVQVLSVNVSVFTLSAIAMDRYRAILYPLKSIGISKREAIYAVLFIWSVSLLLALPQELDYKVIEIKESGKVKPFCAPVQLSDTFRRYYILGLVVIQYVLPLLIISGAYARMATKLWGTTAPGNKEETRDEIALRNKKKVTKMLALVVILFALCWLPLQMYNFFQMITAINEYQYINIIWFCFHWLAMSNSCYNPFIYAIFSDKFQAEFRAKLPCLRRKVEDDGFYSEASDFEMGNCKIPSQSRITPTNRSHRRSQRPMIRTIRLRNEHGRESRSPDIIQESQLNIFPTRSVHVDMHETTTTGVCNSNAGNHANFVTTNQLKIGSSVNISSKT